VAMKHVNEPPRPPREKNSAVPEGLDAVVMRLLQKKPEERYPGAAELVADLQRVGEGLSPVFAAASGAETTQALAGPLAPAPVPRVSGGPPRGFVRIRRRGRARSLAAFVALLAALGVAVLALAWGPDGPVVGSLGRATEGAERVLGVGKGKVPGVVGLAEGKARERLAQEGFGVVVEPRVSSKGESGEVLEQSVAAGREVERGSRIALAVGGGPRSAEVPRLVGLTPVAAERRLEEAGLEPGRREEIPSEAVPAGEVVAQDPTAGEEMKGGVEVDLIVSSGPPKHGGTDRVGVPGDSARGAAGVEPPAAAGGAPPGDSAVDNQYR
jgi:eukaryotic-like serine/threonine-protein kinase